MNSIGLHKISPYTIYTCILIAFVSMFTNKHIATLALTTYMGRFGLSILVVLAGLCHKLIGVASVFAIIILHNMIFIYEPFENIGQTKQQLDNNHISDSIEGYATLEIERSLYGKNSSEFS